MNDPIDIVAFAKLPTQARNILAEWITLNPTKATLSNLHKAVQNRELSKLRNCGKLNLGRIAVFAGMVWKETSTCPNCGRPMNGGWFPKDA